MCGAGAHRDVVGFAEGCGHGWLGVCGGGEARLMGVGHDAEAESERKRQSDGGDG